ncbi:hypothetical protein ACO0E1_01500 [Curtobacterium sp. RRHDQ66]|uniref:hypothetical protein n=1 Tax=Curtobacterium guangdongense TaxID=3413380 RepID=UPI003BF1A9FD
MNTEPPQGDDLQRMLVSMKQNVLARAEADRPAPERRGRRAGIVIGIIAVLGIGVGSGAVALGMVPQPFTAAPAPSPTVTEPPETPTKSSAPVISEPTATPTPTPTRKPFALDDPSTWTISGDEFGPLAIGGETGAETDDLVGAYQHDSADDVCGPEFGSSWVRDGQPTLLVWSANGRVIGVNAWVPPGVAERGVIGPTTSSGIGIGSTIDELRAAYPDLVDDPVNTKDIEPLPAPDAYKAWKTETETGWITFVLGDDGVHVDNVLIGEMSSVSCD